MIPQPRLKGTFEPFGGAVDSGVCASLAATHGTVPRRFHKSLEALSQISNQMKSAVKMPALAR